MSESTNQDHPKKMDEEINIEEQSKNARNFTDLPAPYYSQRGELIPHERHSQLDRQSEKLDDRFGTLKSLESIVSGSTISNQDSADLMFSEDLEALLHTEANKLPENLAVANAEGSRVIFSPETVNNTHDSSELVENRPNQVHENLAVANAEGSSVLFSPETAANEGTEMKMDHANRGFLPLGKDNPSTPSDFSYLTKESVDEDGGDSSSSDEPPTDLERSKKALRKQIFLVIAVLLAYAICSVIYQLYQQIYVAKDELNGKIIPSNVSTTVLDSYITAHPENRIGLWMECNKFDCIDLRLYCSADVIQQKLIASGLVKTATQEQTDDFVKNQMHICPMIRVSRFTSVLSLFAAVIALISLISALRINRKYLYTFLKVGGTLMFILTTITLALFISMKEILDHLVFLAQSFSETRSSTSSEYVDTFYSYSMSFWFCCVSFMLSIVLLALFIVMAKTADKIREEDKRQSETYSISTMESLDLGPRVKSVMSDASSTIRFNESIFNLTNSMDRIESFAEPPIETEKKAVRFS